MDADFCRAVAAADADRTVAPRDEVVIVGPYECNRQMGRGKNTNENAMATADFNLFGGIGSAG